MNSKSNSSKIFFKEEQSLRNGPVMWIIISAFVIVIFNWVRRSYIQGPLGKPLGNHPASNPHLELIHILIFIVMAVILVFVMGMSLVTIIDEKGIRFRFTLIMKEKFISKEKISRFEVRQYKPILEYGGWGFRTGNKTLFKILFMRRAGVAYNVKGNMGLQLYLDDGSKILIGTQKPSGMERAMKKLMNEGGMADG